MLYLKRISFTCFGEFCVFLWILRLRDRTKYQKPWIETSEKSFIEAVYKYGKEKEEINTRKKGILLARTNVLKIKRITSVSKA